MTASLPAHGGGLRLALAASLLLSGIVPAAADLAICGFKPAFMEEFDTLSVAPRELGFGRWTAHTPWNGDFGDAAFADPGPDGPFSVHDGVLTIRARRSADGHWQSGLLAAADSTGAGEGLQYGYFETRMELPAGPGTWPSFWLSSLRAAGAAGPGIEIDVFEFYGHDAAAFQSAVHVWDKDPARSRHEVHKTEVPTHALSDGFHTYGVRVAPDLITFYFDRSRIWQVTTPPEHTLPLFPLVDLALGSGFPIDMTPNPSLLLVDYVHLYRPDPGSDAGPCTAIR